MDRFRIAGIDPAAGLDPNNPQAFVTGLTFVGAGTVNLTMTPLIGGSAVPEPSSLILSGTGLLGLLGYGWCHRKGVNIRS